MNEPTLPELVTVALEEARAFAEPFSRSLDVDFKRSGKKVLRAIGAALSDRAVLAGKQYETDSVNLAQRPSDTPAAKADSARLHWLHAPGANDVDGYEWGIYRVKWVNGRAAEVWQTNADFSDLDAAIGKAERSAAPRPNTGSAS